MDFESPDVEKDFPGLYASETGRKSNESDFSDGGEHEKPSKKDLLGRRKEKKEKKDRGYAALEGESSPEEDTDANCKLQKNREPQGPVGTALVGTCTLAPLKGGILARGMQASWSSVVIKAGVVQLGTEAVNPLSSCKLLKNREPQGPVGTALVGTCTLAPLKGGILARGMQASCNFGLSFGLDEMGSKEAVEVMGPLGPWLGLMGMLSGRIPQEPGKGPEPRNCVYHNNAQHLCTQLYSTQQTQSWHVMVYSVVRWYTVMHHLRNVFAKEKEEKAKFKLESKEKLKDEKKEKVKDKDKDKVKEKDKEKVKEKDKEKVKEKDKDKKDKKLTKVPSTVTSGVPFEEIFTLGVALPIFGVPLLQSVERSRCHDDSRLPLVVRDSIDYLQANGLKSNQIYRTEPDKIKLQQLRKLYTDRGPTFPYHWDVPVACAMLKSFISELPDSILTQELHGQFEQATAIAEPQRETTMMSLVGKLPPCNYNLLAWLMRHFESVVANEQVNHASIQTITTAMGPALNMSFNLITYFVTKAEKLFPDVHLTK
ncbi:ralA-binding protein 1-like [Ostrinia furnacalis]|uniref:ralA-binding protein 1-like n=1 Tax=Ostrinia furnacalis TaxID=93504 RepID=UPI00103B4A1F|nr:ralA-binding protein 1-like [Ostrinia furnacalis]